MVNFSEIVAVSRDAHLRQLEREQTDQTFVEGVMKTVQEQVEAEGGSVTVQGEWTRLSENATNTFLITFPDGCNVQEVGITVAGHTSPARSVFMVGPAGRSPEAAQVDDRAEAVQLVLQYLMDVVKEVRRLRER